MRAQRKTVLDWSPFVLYAQLDGSHGVQEILTVTKVLLDGCSVADHAYQQHHRQAVSCSSPSSLAPNGEFPTRRPTGSRKESSSEAA
jgi:hypothetical protein